MLWWILWSIATAMILYGAFWVDCVRGDRRRGSRIAWVGIGIVLASWWILPAGGVK